jgi:hypothetical protein
MSFSFFTSGDIFLLFYKKYICRFLKKSLTAQEDQWYTDLTNLRQEISRLTICLNDHEAVNKNITKKLIECRRVLAIQLAHKSLRMRDIIRKWRDSVRDGRKNIPPLVERLIRNRVSIRCCIYIYQRKDTVNSEISYFCI